MVLARKCPSLTAFSMLVSFLLAQLTTRILFWRTERDLLKFGPNSGEASHKFNPLSQANHEVSYPSSNPYPSFLNYLAAMVSEGTSPIGIRAKVDADSRRVTIQEPVTD